MKNNNIVYWACQTGGWLSYGFSMFLFAFTTDQSLSKIRYGRIGIGITLGFLVTLLLREFILKLELHPPLSKNKWWMIFCTVIATAFLYSVVNSALVEWTHLYNPEKKVSIQQRTWYNFISDGPIIFAWASFYYLWQYIEINTTSQLDKIRLESLVKDLELKTIKSHINPHFIFNALNSIRALVDENPESARTAITLLSSILRSSMQAEKLELAPLEREIGIIKDYLALEKIRFEDRLSVIYDIDANSLSQLVPPMMLQTLVENALKHGIGKLKKGGVIKVISRMNASNLELLVQNTGQLSHNANQEGFGIASTHNRLNLLYGKEAVFNLVKLDDNTVEAKVSIPIANEN